ncbi:hypothetical protein [Myroides sp. N17-2]|uniref:hypothetical protein n=1 Tax=Myroides sp. N17-2 TaxID=2030799 RepID=UPI000EFC8ACA|nr:hypothetical protein [Myroides sp. N17-2]
MNFDDLKKSWQEQSIEDSVSISNDLGAQVSHLPLEKVRKNVKKEIWVQVLSVILVAFTPQLLKLNASRIGGFYLFYILFVLICGYYIFKMYIFYKRSASLNLNSKDSVYESYYSLKLYIQLYESFSYSLIPFGILLLLAVTSSNTLDSILRGDITSLIKLGIASVIMLGFIYVLLKIWISKLYGQYLIQIENTLELFTEQE